MIHRHPGLEINPKEHPVKLSVMTSPWTHTFVNKDMSAPSKTGATSLAICRSRTILLITLQLVSASVTLSAGISCQANSPSAFLASECAILA